MRPCVIAEKSGFSDERALRDFFKRWTKRCPIRFRKVLDECGFSKVNIRLADGTQGWQDMAPFDAIIVTAGAPEVPQDYLTQLAVGGRLVIPVGNRESQVLMRITRTAQGEYQKEQLLGCRFVPLVGKHGWEEGQL